MFVVATFDPSASTSGTFNAQFQGGVGKILVINESQVNLLLTFGNGQQAYSPAGDRRLFCVATPSATVLWSQQSLLGGPSPSVSQVIVEAYAPTEKIIETYPSPLVRQTNIGNSLPVSTSAQEIINSGNAADTAIVTATQTGASSANVSMDNDGDVTIKEGTSSQTTLFQIVTGAAQAVLLGGTTPAARAVKAVGEFFLGNGKLGVTSAGDVLDASSATVTNLKARSAGTINLQTPSGTTQVAVSSTGLLLTAGKLGVTSAGDVLDASSATSTYIKARSSGNIIFETPDGTGRAAITTAGLSFDGYSTGIRWRTGDTLSGTHTFTGTTTGTYTHGAGGTPFIVIPMCSVSGSQTMGYDTVTSTQVHITSGAGLGFKALTLLG